MDLEVADRPSKGVGRAACARRSLLGQRCVRVPVFPCFSWSVSRVSRVVEAGEAPCYALSGGDPAPHPRATWSGSHVGPVLVSAGSRCVWPGHGGVCFAKGVAVQTDCRSRGHLRGLAA